MEQSGRRTLGIRRRQQGAVGLGAAAVRPDAAGPRGVSAPQPGQAAHRAAGRQSRRQGDRPDRARRGRDLGRSPASSVSTPTSSAWCCASANMCARCSRASTITCRIRSRRCSRPRSLRVNSIDIGMRIVEDLRRGTHHPRRAGREPDAHRRREHRRRRFLRVVEDQAERRRRLSVQHPAARRHREGGGRKRHARGGRPLQHSADPDRRAPEHRDRRCRS